MGLFIFDAFSNRLLFFLVGLFMFSTLSGRSVCV